MARDCQAGRSEGWTYFIAPYVPAIRKLAAHYAAGDATVLDRVLLAARKPESNLFQSAEPRPERMFVAELRQAVVAESEPRPAEIPLDLETVATALEPLTLAEKQAAWFETMGYDPAETGSNLRMAPATVERI